MDAAVDDGYFTFFWASRFGEYCHKLGLKRVVRIPNRGSVRQLNPIVHYVNGREFGIGHKWSILHGPFVRQSNTGFPTVYTLGLYASRYYRGCLIMTHPDNYTNKTSSQSSMLQM